jgi:hypothetical protein
VLQNLQEIILTARIVLPAIGADILFAMLFMVIKNFRNRDPKPIHDRFVRRGRLLPEGVTYSANWIDPARARCYQVMEAENAEALAPWIAAWNDIVEFEVVPVVVSAEFWATRMP